MDVVNKMESIPNFPEKALGFLKGRQFFSYQADIFETSVCLCGTHTYIIEFCHLSNTSFTTSKMATQLLGQTNYFLNHLNLPILPICGKEKQSSNTSFSVCSQALLCKSTSVCSIKDPMTTMQLYIIRITFLSQTRYSQIFASKRSFSAQLGALSQLVLNFFPPLKTTICLKLKCSCLAYISLLETFYFFTLLEVLFVFLLPLRPFHSTLFVRCRLSNVRKVLEI